MRATTIDSSKLDAQYNADIERAIAESRRSSQRNRVDDRLQEIQQERSQIGNLSRGVAQHDAYREANLSPRSMATGRSEQSTFGVFANLNDTQLSLMNELVEINGQDCYDSLTAGIGKLKQDEFLVLPLGLTIRDVEPATVGKRAAHAHLSPSDWADIYALNKAVAPAGSDAMTFGLLRLEAVKCGWLKDMREVRMDTPPADAMLILANDMGSLREKAADIKTASFLMPLIAEHTFRTMGHHFITTDQANYVQRYSDTFRACLMPHLANLLPPAVMFHNALHWVGPGRARSVLEAQLDSPSIPDALRIRANAAPAGTAILTTTAAIIDAMAGVGLDAAFETHGNFGLPTIRQQTDRVKQSPCKYHKAYFAYGIAKATQPEVDQLDRAKQLAEKFAPYAQAFIDTYMRDAALGKARAIKKHAENNPIQMRRASTLFRMIARAPVTSVEDLIKARLTAITEDM
jgi:hypothetical protein